MTEKAMTERDNHDGEEKATSQQARRSSIKIRPLLGSQMSRLRKGAEAGLKRLGFPPTDENIKLFRDIRSEVMGRIFRKEVSPEVIHDLILDEMKKRASQSSS
jgi:hypothetical protein